MDVPAGKACGQDVSAEFCKPPITDPSLHSQGPPTSRMATRRLQPQWVRCAAHNSACLHSSFASVSTQLSGSLHLCPGVSHELFMGHDCLHTVMHLFIQSWSCMPAGVLERSQPVAACVVEFAGGPGTWVTRTYTATAGGGAFFNGQPISASSCSSIAQSLLVGSAAPANPSPHPVGLRFG